MAYISAYAANQEITDTTSITVDMSEHVTGDLLIVVAGKDDATGGSLSLSGTGWTSGREANQGSSGNNTIRYAWWWKWADSDDEASPVISSSDADTWCASCLTIKGAYYNAGSEGDFIDVENSNNDTGNPYLATGLNTNYDNSLYIVMAGTDGAVSTCAIPGYMNVVNQDGVGNGLGIAWTVIPDADVTAPDIEFYGTGTADEHVFLKVAIRDSGEGLIPAYPSSDLGTMITPFYGTGIFKTGDAVVANNNDMPILGGRFDPTAVFQEDASGGPSYVDYTTAATNATDADVVPYPATEVAGASGTGDCFLIGYSAPFGAVQFDRAGCTAGVAGVAAREYWNGSTWVALKNVYDQTTSFTVAVGDYHMFGFTIPTDWASTTINGTNAYYIRLRCTTLWSTNPTISQIWVGKLALVFDAIAAVADTGVNPFHSSLASSPAATGNVTSGANFNFATTQRDVTSGILVGTYLFGTPRDYTDLGPVERGAGLLFNLGDTSNNHRGWIIGSFGDGGRTFPDDRNIYAVQVGQSTDTSYLVTSSAPTLTSCQKVLLAPNCYLGPALVYFNQLQRIDELVVNGGGSGKPVTYDDLVVVANGSYVPLIKNNVCFTPIRFGGDGPVYVDMGLFALSYPLTAKDGGTKVHVDDNVFEITIDARSGDTLKIRNAQLSGKSLWAFTVAGTAESSGVTYDFLGLSIINATVTLRDVTTFSGMSFINCDSFDLQTGVDIADSTFTLKEADTFSFTGSGHTFVGCSFDCSAVASGSAGIQTADPSDFSNCTFTGGGGHALELTTTTGSPFTFTGNTFTGFGADASNGAAIYNNSGGAITISIAGGGSTPTVRNGAGASTTIQNAVTVTVTVKDAASLSAIENARVLLEADAGGDLPAGESISISRSGSTASVSHTAHGMTTGMSVIIRGATEDEYNGIFTISNVSANAYDYTVSGTPASPATGSPTATCAILSGLTNASGILQTASFNFTSSQPVTGKVRKGTSGTLYKTGAITGTITSTGLDTTVLLITDE